MADRQDGYLNTVIGHGMKNKDPSANFSFSPGPILTDQMLSDLFMGNAIARKIVSLPADEAVKNWITVEGDEEAGLALQMLDDLNAEAHFANALRWSRLYGGCVILLVADDGGLLDEPLNENKLQSIQELRVYDKTQVFWNDAVLYEDPRNMQYGKAQYYQITPACGMPFLVHESRLLLFPGDPLPDLYRLRYQGWGLPSLQGLWDELLNNGHAQSLALKIMERMSQAILKLDGLLENLTTQEGEGEVKKRLELIDTARSIMNTIAIDAKDEFEVKSMSLTQIPELLDSFGLAVSAVANIPFTVLFGRSPAGMNATGESDLEGWYGYVGQIQKRQAKSPLDRLVRLLMLSKQGLFKGRQPEKWAVKFNPLWVPSEKEQAETEKFKAETDKTKAEERQVYVGMSALDPSEVRQKLADEGEYEIDLSLKPVDPTPEEIPKEEINPEEPVNVTEAA